MWLLILGSDHFTGLRLAWILVIIVVWPVVCSNVCFNGADGRSFKDAETAAGILGVEIT